MERIPLNESAEFKMADNTVLYLKLEQKNSYEPFCLEYTAAGRCKGRDVSGVVYEYFPDDDPNMYYDIRRETNMNISVGYLSEKAFGKGKSNFSEYFNFIKKHSEKKGNYIEVIPMFNTVYAFVDDRLSMSVSNDYKKDLLKLTDGAALLTEHGFRINCSQLISVSDSLVFPCGAYVGLSDDENLTDLNIFSFGQAVFSFLFGRKPATPDRRFYSDWDRSEITADIQISDQDFEILKNLLRLTLQVTRRNCFSDFRKVRNELLKLK